jgi:hypothetical protein
MAFNAVGTNRFGIEAVTADIPRGAPSRAVSACIVFARLFAERLTAASHRRGLARLYHFYLPLQAETRHNSCDQIDKLSFLVR